MPNGPTFEICYKILRNYQRCWNSVCKISSKFIEKSAKIMRSISFNVNLGIMCFLAFWWIKVSLSIFGFLGMFSKWWRIFWEFLSLHHIVGGDFCYYDYSTIWRHEHSSRQYSSDLREFFSEHPLMDYSGWVWKSANLHIKNGRHGSNVL